MKEAKVCSGNNPKTYFMNIKLKGKYLFFRTLRGFCKFQFCFLEGRSIISSCRDYHALTDTAEVAARLEHNIAEFVKQHGSLHLKLYDVNNKFSSQPNSKTTNCEVWN